jgi:hypothetical protein
VIPYEEVIIIQQGNVPPGASWYLQYIGDACRAVPLVVCTPHFHRYMGFGGIGRDFLTQDRTGEWRAISEAYCRAAKLLATVQPLDRVRLVDWDRRFSEALRPEG